MRNAFAASALSALFTAVSFGQADKTFYFTPPVTLPEMTAMATTIRTVVDLRDVSIDKVRQALVTQGPVEKSVAAEWVFHHLDGPGGQSAPAEYKMFGDKGEVIAVIPVAPSGTLADLTAVTTAVRTVADIQRLFPYEWREAMVARDTAERIAAAEWIAQQVSPSDGQAPTGDSAPYPMAPQRPDWDPEEIRVFRMDPKSTDADLTSMVTAIRTVADLQRLFPFSTGKALIARGSQAKVAVAEWLVHERAKPADTASVHQTTLMGLMDGVVRLFCLGPQTSDTDLTALVTQIRATTGVNRIFPLNRPPAVVLRGRPDQMRTVEGMVAKFLSEAH
jgi:hypothetical protein